MSGTGTEVNTGGAETVNADAAAVAAAAAAANTGAAETGADSGAASVAAQVPGWVQPRIDGLTREKYEAQRAREIAEARAAAAEAALEELRRGGTGEAAAGAERTATGGTSPRMLTVEEAEAFAEQKARNMAFAQRTQEVYQKGKEAFKDDFDTALRNLANVGFGNNGASRQLIEAAMEAGNPHEILHELAKDLNTAGQILQLGPAQMGIRLAQVATKVKEAPKMTKTPDPITGIVGGTGGRVAGDIYNTESSIDDWMVQRNKTARKRRR